MVDQKVKRNSLRGENTEEIENSHSVLYLDVPETSNEDGEDKLQTDLGKNTLK